MTEIIMCSSVSCPLKKDCYRAYEIVDAEYFNFEYTCNENSGFCEFIRKVQSKAKKES